MNNIKGYYYIIIGLGVFIMFALLGYLVETSKKNKDEEKKVEDNNVEGSNSVNDNIIINNEIIENKSEEILIDKDILNK